MKNFLLFLLQLLLLPAGQLSAQLVVAPTTSECATSIDGSVVGVPNPLQPPQISPVFSGTLPSGNYFTVFAWYDAASHVTLVSPEVQTQLSATGQLQISPPSSGMPATAAGMEVFIGTTSGAETLQGTTTGSATFIQSTPLSSGTALPSTNTTLCQIIANDAGWPTGTGYQVSLTTPAGDTYPGYPMQWQLLGPGGTINVGNGLPRYNGVVTYPVPILASPYGHATQSITGGLNLGNYPFSAGSGTFSGTVTASGIPMLYGPGTYVALQNGAFAPTTLNTLTILAPLLAFAAKAAAGTLSGVIGITVANPYPSPSAIIQENGLAPCVFDGPTTAADYVQVSSTTAGDCHDSGSQSFPAGTQVVGKVLSTNSGAGTYFINLNAADTQPLLGTAAIASIATDAGAGTGASVTCPSCTDAGGIVVLTTGTSPPASNPIFTLTFGAAHNHSWCTFSPASGQAAAYSGVEIAQGTSNFVLVSGSPGLTASVIYEWTYTCAFN